MGIRTTRRRLVLSAAATSALTVACGSGASGSEKSTAPGQLPAQPTTLTYITWVGKPQSDLVQRALDDFKQAHPTITTEITVIPQDQMILKPTTMAAAGIPPDILETNDKQFTDSLGRNLFSDLTPLVNRDKAAVNVDDFYPVYIATFKTQNKLYALPDFTGTSVYFYNKKLFDQASVKYPDYTWTWDTLEEMGRKMTQRFPEGTNVFMVQPFAQDIRWLPFFLWSNGGTMYEGWGPMLPDKTVVRIYSPQNIKAAQRYVDWIDKFHFIAKPSETSDWSKEMQASVLSGKDSVPGFKLLDWMNDHGAMTLPPKGTEPRRSRTTTRGASIPNGVKSPEASWAVVKYVTGKDGLETTIAGGYTQPVRKSAEPAFARTLLPFEDLKVYQDSQKYYTDPMPNHSRWIEQEPIIRDYIQSAVKGERTVDQALKELQTQLELSLKEAAGQMSGK